MPGNGQATFVAASTPPPKADDESFSVVLHSKGLFGETTTKFKRVVDVDEAVKLHRKVHEAGRVASQANFGQMAPTILGLCLAGLAIAGHGVIRPVACVAVAGLAVLDLLFNVLLADPL